MSRRIVIACWGSYGDVYPYIGLAKALTSRGHRPLLAAPSYYRAAADLEAVEFAGIGPEVDPRDREVMARVMHPAKGTEAVVRELVLPALRHTYEDLRRVAAGADLLVSHPLTFAVPLLAEVARVPWISTVLAPLGFFSITDFPVLPPAPWLARLRGLGLWLPRVMLSVARRATAGWMDLIYELRAELGLPRGGHPLFDGQFSPRMTLALFSRVMASPQPDWPSNVRTTGFVFYNGPGVLSPELESFLDAGPPPVVFTLGTSAVGAAGRFYHESIEAVARLGVRAVLLTGGFPENRPAGRLSTDVLLVDRAPHQLLFPRASAVVHQVGIGTTGQALRSGQPMLVVPHGHDQPDNASRVTTLGVARTVFPRYYKAPRVAKELQRLLGDRHYQERATAVADVIRSEGGADAAADAIAEVFT